MCLPRIWWERCTGKGFEYRTTSLYNTSSILTTDLIYRVVILELDEPEPPLLPRLLISHDRARQNVAVHLEVIPQILLLDVLF